MMMKSLIVLQFDLVFEILVPLNVYSACEEFVNEGFDLKVDTLADRIWAVDPKSFNQYSVYKYISGHIKIRKIEVIKDEIRTILR